MTPPLSHDEFRRRVCGCFLHAGRKSVKNISQSILQDLQMYQWEEYSLGNNALPTVICGSCRLKLLKCKGVSSLHFKDEKRKRTFILSRSQTIAQSQMLTTSPWFLPLYVREVPLTGTSALSARRAGLPFSSNLRSLTQPWAQSRSARAARVGLPKESPTSAPRPTGTTIFWRQSGRFQPKTRDKFFRSL